MDTPLQEQFPLLKMQRTADECFPMSQLLLCWTNPQYSLVARSAKAAFQVSGTDRLFDAHDALHSRYPSFEAYVQEILLRSTETLFPIEPAVTMMRTFPVPFSEPEHGVPAGPPWPHTHTMEVAADGVHVRTASGTIRLDVVTVSGFLRWERSSTRGQYYVVESVPSGGAFAGALIATEKREGHMTCLVFSPSNRDIDIRFVRLAEKHLNAIRRLKLDHPPQVA
jgi:hypothetical protein